MIFPNGRVAEVYLNLARRGALGEYLKFRKICAYTFELCAGQLVQRNQLLDQMEISVINSVLIIMD